MRTNTIACVFALILASGFTTLGAIEVGANLSGGGSYWEGAWADTKIEFSNDFGQDPVSVMFPVISFSADILFQPWDLFDLVFSVGGGNWGGRIISESDSEAQWVSTILFGEMDFSTLVGKQFQLWKRTIGIWLKFGLGAIETPVYIFETWNDVSSTQTIHIDPDNSLFLFNGISAAYGRPVGLFLLSGTLSFDSGTAYLTNSRDMDIFYRFCLGLRISYNFSRNNEELK